MNEDNVWKTSKIKKIIDDKKNDKAFIIGNGINLYENINSFSWKELLISLYEGEEEKDPDFLKGLSFTELYDILELKKYEKGINSAKDAYKKRSNNANKIQEKEEKISLTKIASEIRLNIANKLNKNIINTIVERIRDLDVPLLTTNYDKNLSNSINTKKMNLIRTKEGIPFSHYYAWNCYYGEKTNSQKQISGFGIWHIHGTIDYPASIKIGLSDYMRCVTKVRNLLSEKGITLNDKDTKKKLWKGSNTWLHIFFNKSLIIFGLGLEENETFLRWLLIQRKKYILSRKDDMGISDWYIYSNDETISLGKKSFLESVGFKIIKAKNYQAIYDDLWK